VQQRIALSGARQAKLFPVAGQRFGQNFQLALTGALWLISFLILVGTSLCDGPQAGSTI
jgi:hypothetical protein